MSEDRLEKALEAMKNESITPEEMAGAKARVWEKLGVPVASACAEFQPHLKEYLEGGLAGNRRLLVEDHLGRCPECRRQLGVVKGDQPVVVAMPQRTRRAWPQWRAWAVAAALVLVMLYVGRTRIDSLLAPSGPRATVASLSGDLYRLPEGALKAGATIGEGEVVRTGPGSRAVLRLADGSMVDVNERSELYVRAAWSGQTIYLDRGDVVVQAAKQRRGNLRVQTRDSLASVKGTVFAVSSGLSGSVVTVLEGSVEVAQPGTDRVLKPGEQAASNPSVETLSVNEAFSWSPDAEKYAALLADFASLQKKIAAISSPASRTQARLLQFLPANAVAYAAAPNLTGTIRQVVQMAEQQAAESAAFREWWESDAGKDLRKFVDHVQSVTPLLGEEICFVQAQSVPGGKGADLVPMLMAEVQPGRAAQLKAALDAVRAQAPSGPEAGPAYYVADTLMVVSDSTAHLQWAVSHAGQGAGSPFAVQIAQRYQRGVGWLAGGDFLTLGLLAQAPAGPATNMSHQDSFFSLPSSVGMKHIFIEQRSAQGGEENQVTVTFQGPRTGMSGWLANSGTSGAAEYISGEAIFATAASTREPRQIFQEMMAQLARLDPKSATKMTEDESKLGISFANDLAAALGTDFAFAFEPPLVPKPGFFFAVLVNNPGLLDSTIRKLIEAGRAQDPSAPALVQETIDGRVWNSVVSQTGAHQLYWTYDRGYLVAAPDRAVALRAIATRGSFPLIYSAAFQQQLPASAGVHPSGFAWVNTKGALEGVAAMVQSPALQKLASQRDPILVVINGETEQIHASSRTQLSSLILDMMSLEAAGRSQLQQAAPAGARAKPKVRNDSTSH